MFCNDLNNNFKPGAQSSNSETNSEDSVRGPLVSAGHVTPMALERTPRVQPDTTHIPHCVTSSLGRNGADKVRSLMSAENTQTTRETCHKSK